MSPCIKRCSRCSCARHCSRALPIASDAVEKLFCGGTTVLEGGVKCLPRGQRTLIALLIASFFQAKFRARGKGSFSTASSGFDMLPCTPFRHLYSLWRWSGSLGGFWHVAQAARLRIGSGNYELTCRGVFRVRHASFPIHQLRDDKSPQ